MGLFGVVPSYKIVTLIVVLKWYNLEPKDENKLSFQILQIKTVRLACSQLNYRNFLKLL